MKMCQAGLTELPAGSSEDCSFPEGLPSPLPVTTLIPAHKVPSPSEAPAQLLWTQTGTSLPVAPGEYLGEYFLAMALVDDARIFSLLEHLESPGGILSCVPALCQASGQLLGGTGQE